MDAVVADDALVDVEGAFPPLLAFLEETEISSSAFFGLQIYHERIQNPSANPPIKIYLHDEEVRLRLDIMCVALAEVAIAVAIARVPFLLARRFELPRTAVILGTTIESATNGPIFQMRIGDRKSFEIETQRNWLRNQKQMKEQTVYAKPLTDKH